MRLLLATDAWSPQVNGVVRTFEATLRCLAGRGVEVEVIAPDGFGTLPLPTYPDIRIALCSAAQAKRRIEAFRPDAIHIATEGPIGWATRQASRSLGLAFTTSYHTRFPEYLSARLPVPEGLSYAVLRHFHAAAAATMVSTASLRRELAERGFTHLAPWSRGVDTRLFDPAKAGGLKDLPRPVFLTVSRLAVEKNVEAFLSLDLPGSKVVVGEGPARAELAARHPEAHFLGLRTGEELARIYAGADAFVFPSLTDTFGIVLLEAAASGLPVAAFPVTGPRDVIGGSGAGVLDEDLGRAALAALAIPRAACRAFALGRSWEGATDQFLGNLVDARCAAQGALAA